MFSSRSRTVIRIVVLGGAAALALREPFAKLRGGTWHELPSITGWAEGAFAAMEPRPGEHVGLLVPPRDAGQEEALWYAAQYALVPALVEPVMVRACATEPARCRFERSNVVLAPFAPPEAIALAAARLGLAPAGAVGPVPLLTRARDER